MIPATCHADREHVAHGLCDCCYRSTVYYAERDAQLARNKAYRKANAAELRAKRKARYAKTRKEGDAAWNNVPVQLDTGETSDDMEVIAPLANNAAPRFKPEASADKQWWREEAKPRRWIIEAQQEAA